MRYFEKQSKKDDSNIAKSMAIGGVAGGVPAGLLGGYVGFQQAVLTGGKRKPGRPSPRVTKWNLIKKHPGTHAFSTARGALMFGLPPAILGAGIGAAIGSKTESSAAITGAVAGGILPSILAGAATMRGMDRRIGTIAKNIAVTGIPGVIIGAGAGVAAHHLLKKKEK